MANRDKGWRRSLWPLLQAESADWGLGRAFAPPAETNGRAESEFGVSDIDVEAEAHREAVVARLVSGIKMASHIGGES